MEPVAVSNPLLACRPVSATTPSMMIFDLLAFVYFEEEEDDDDDLCFFLG